MQNQDARGTVWKDVPKEPEAGECLQQVCLTKSTANRIADLIPALESKLNVVLSPYQEPNGALSGGPASAQPRTALGCAIGEINASLEESEARLWNIIARLSI